MLRLTPANQTNVVLNAIMLTALIAVLCGPVVRYNPTWNPIPLVIVCFGIALEAGFVHRKSHSGRFSMGEQLRYLVPELLVLVVVMRVIATLGTSGTALVQMMNQWLYDPLSIMDPALGVHVFLGLAVGWMAYSTASDLITLAPRPGDQFDSHPDDHERYAALLSDERNAAMRQIGSRFATGGALLVLALSLEAVNIRQIGGPAIPITTLSSVAALCYTMCGFLLQSRARLNMLQSRWHQEGAKIARSVPRRWSRGSLLLIAYVLLAATLLPRNYGMGLLDALRAGLGIIGTGLAILGYLITWFFGMLLLIPAYLLSLLAPQSSGPDNTPPLVLPPPPVFVEREPPLWPAIIFWLCMTILIGIAMRHLLRRHPRLFAGMLAQLGRFLRELRLLWRSSSGWVELVVHNIVERLNTDTDPSQPHSRRSPRRDSRAWVAFYYQQFLSHAAQAGFPRHTGQTPLEYRQHLDSERPESAPELAEFTEQYLHARYAPEPVTPVQARQARTLWQRLRRLFQ